MDHPIGISLLFNKTSETYYIFFTPVRDAMAGLTLIFNPSNIMSDFESGQIETVKLVFLSATH